MRGKGAAGRPVTTRAPCLPTVVARAALLSPAFSGGSTSGHVRVPNAARLPLRLLEQSCFDRRTALFQIVRNERLTLELGDPPQCPDEWIRRLQGSETRLQLSGRRSSEVATAPHDDASAEPCSFVGSERLGLEPGASVAILENVSDADCGGDLLDPALHQLEVGVVAQAEGV
jgi:hypothetical protein